MIYGINCLSYDISRYEINLLRRRFRILEFSYYGTKLTLYDVIHSSPQKQSSSHWTLSSSSPLCSVSGVGCPSVLPRQLLLPASLLSCDQLLTLVLASLSAASSTLILGSPYHFRIRRDFMSKNPLSGFAPKQTRLLWRPAPIVLHLGIFVLWNKIDPI